MSFNIVDVNNNFSVVLGEDGQPLVFEDGRAAAQAAADLSFERGGRFQPRRIVSDDSIWHEREAQRFAVGTYRKPLFADEEWFSANEEVRFHFAHLSTDDPSKIAFTENAEMGRADRQTRMKVGRYLERFFSHLPASHRQRLVSEHSAMFCPQPIRFARTAEEIEWVYVNGPHSCMAYPTNNQHFSVRDFHPSAVYAGPDLAVAYLLNDDDRVSARAVVWPEQKKHFRVYGDLRLHEMLRQDGYTNESLTGARLQRIDLPEGGVLMPYLDCAEYCREEGDFLVIDQDEGYIQCRSTQGRTWIDRTSYGECGCCGKRSRHRRMMVISVDLQATSNASRYPQSNVCRTCLMNDGLAIPRLGNLRFHRNLVEERDGQRWLVGEYAIHQRRLARQQTREIEAAQTFVCGFSGETLPWNEGVNIRYFDGSRVIRERWSKAAAAGRTARCFVTRHLYTLACLTTLHDGRTVNARCPLALGAMLHRDNVNA